MTHGGKRPGAGRKKSGLPAKKIIERQILTEAVVERAKAEGPLPLDIMLENARHFHKVANDAEKVLESFAADSADFAKLPPEEQFKVMLAKVKHAAGLRMLAQQCAEGASPLVHPRLSPVEAEKPKVVNQYFIGNVEVNVTQVRNEISTIFDDVIARSPAKDAKRVN